VLTLCAVLAGPNEAGIDERVGRHVCDVVFADEIRLKSHNAIALAGKYQ
jgi:hypothetical protein